MTFTAVYARAQHLASKWGAELSDAGESGHINIASGQGPWPDRAFAVWEVPEETRLICDGVLRQDAVLAFCRFDFVDGCRECLGHDGADLEIVDLDALGGQVSLHFAEDIVVAFLGKVGFANVFDVGLRAPRPSDPSLAPAHSANGLVPIEILRPGTSNQASKANLLS